MGSIYTIIFLLSLSVCLSVCQRSQTAGRNSCSIVSGDVSNWSYCLTVHFVTSSRLSSAKQLFYMRKTSKTSGEIGSPACLFIWMASDWHCLASVEKEAPNHDGVMVGRTENSEQRVVVGCVRVRECERVWVRACMRAWCVCNIR